jgi:hypothetical protein
MSTAQDTGGFSSNVARRRELSRVRTEEEPDQATEAAGGDVEPESVSGVTRREVTPRRAERKQTLNTRIPTETYDRMERAKRNGYAVTDIVDAALTEYFERHPNLLG